MEEIQRLNLRYGSAALALSAALGAGLFLLGRPEAGRGLVLGGLFSALNFLLLSISVRRQVLGRPREGRRFPIGSVAVRWVFLSLPVAAAARFDRYDLAATVAGLFAVQAVILFEAVILKPDAKRRTQPP